MFNDDENSAFEGEEIFYIRPAKSLPTTININKVEDLQDEDVDMEQDDEEEDKENFSRKFSNPQGSPY